MKQYTTAQYTRVNCALISSLDGYVVHRLTGGKMCDTGCAAFNGGKCSAYVKLTKPIPIQKQYKETVRAEAQRRNLSIKQVRRERRNEQFETRATNV